MKRVSAGDDHSPEGHSSCVHNPTICSLLSCSDELLNILIKENKSYDMKQINQHNRVCSMRLATNTRYTLCTIKSVYVYHESHVVAATLLVWHHQCLEGLVYQGLIELSLWSCTLGCTHSESDNNHSRHNMPSLLHHMNHIILLGLWFGTQTALTFV